MTKKRDLSIWERHGLPDFDDWKLYIEALDMTIPEIEGWIEATKAEAWIHEKLGKHENEAYNLAVARYFWRRTDMLKNYKKQLEQELDNEEAQAKGE